jgi:hypothetical protein
MSAENKDYIPNDFIAGQEAVFGSQEGQNPIVSLDNETIQDLKMEEQLDSYYRQSGTTSLKPKKP